MDSQYRNVTEEYEKIQKNIMIGFIFTASKEISLLQAVGRIALRSGGTYASESDSVKTDCNLE